MAEGYSTMMRISLLNKHMAIETAHLRDSEDADAAEGTSCYRENFALCDIGTELAVSSALETVEGDVSGINVALQGATGNIRGVAVLQETILNELVLDAALL